MGTNGLNERTIAISQVQSLHILNISMNFSHDREILGEIGLRAEKNSKLEKEKNVIGSNTNALSIKQSEIQELAIEAIRHHLGISSN